MTHMKTANIVISCPDKKGIVHRVTWFLFENNANIVNLEQHVEDKMFFMRIEWDMFNFSLTKEMFLERFLPIINEYNIEIKFDLNERKKRIGLFCSKEIHCLWDILMRHATNELDVDISFVISNFEECKELVEKFNIPFYHTPCKKDNSDHEIMQYLMIKKHKTDFLWLARYMKILSANFILKAWQQIINVHHSFLPSFIWANPYEQAYERWVKIIWATSHYVTPELDQWPIIHQTIHRINHNHTAQSLKIIWRESEKEVFAFALKKHIENKIIVYKNRTIVFE